MSGPRIDLRRQRGVAVITALLLTTLAITIVASLFWQQQVQVRSIENQQLQSKKQEVLRGGLDYARWAIRNDDRRVDHLGEPWGIPLRETPLDSYVENGRADTDASDAALSGNIVDAQSLFNLFNLCDAGVPNKGEIIAFGTLLSNAGVDPKLAKATADMMEKAQKAQKATQATGSSQTSQPMDLTQVGDLLAVPGFTPEILDKVRQWLVVLPNRGTTLNINTAPAEVLAAKIDKFSLAEAKVVVADRERAYFRDGKNLIWHNRVLSPVPDANGLGITTNFFLVNGKVRLSRASLEVQSLIDRTEGTPGGTKIVWMREK